MPAANVVPRRYRWTPVSRRILSALIKGTVSYNRALGAGPSDYRDLASEGCSYVTVRNYAVGAVRDLQQRDIHARPLALLAPKLYIFSGVSPDGQILMDTTRKYETWIQLADQIADLEALPGVSGIEIDQADEKSLPGEAVAVAESDGFQLSLPTITPNLDHQFAEKLAETVAAKLSDKWIQTLGSIESRLQELERRINGSQPTEKAMKTMAPLPNFLADWVAKAPPERKQELGLEDLDAEAAIEKLLADLVELDPVKIKSVLTGGALEDRDLFQIGYHITDHKTGKPYDLDLWLSLTLIEARATSSAAA